MNFKKQNIDEIFRNGLDNYTETPSTGSWKLITGRLLRKEIMHFNFTNVPAAWIGIATTAIITASLIIYNLNLTSPEEVVDHQGKQDNYNKEITTGTQPGQPKTEDISVADGNIPVDNSNDVSLSPKTDQKIEDNTANANDLTPTGITEVIVSQTNPVPPSPVIPSSTALSVEQTPDKITARAGLPVVDNNSFTVTPQVEKTSEVLISTSALTLQDDTPDINNLESRKASLETPTTHGKIGELTPATAPVIDSPIRETNITSARSGSGKILKMHSLSFSIGQFLRGRYKPPQRDLEDMYLKYNGKKYYLSLAAYLTPEFINYQRNTSVSFENGYIGGVALSYNSASYIIQSGIEYGYYNDQGDYMINMQTYDSIGFYNEVGSFIIDPDNPGSVIFDTDTVVVMDSVPHQSFEQTRNHYSYLQVPLLIGYKALERGNFSAFIKIGPCFSFLLDKVEPPVNYNNPDATIHTIDNYTPARLNSNIQFMMSLGMQFQFSDHLGAMIEPTYKYYFRSVYSLEDKSAKNPYSIGVRGGVFYNF